MTDYEVFGEAFGSFLENCEEILKKSDSEKTNQTGDNPVLKYLKKYRKFFDMTDPQDHSDYFLAIYNRHRTIINKGHNRDAWLKDASNAVTVQYGIETKKPPKNVKIMLTSIYLIACRLQEEVESKIDSIPEDMLADYPQLNYPELFMLYLYRMFASIVEDDKHRTQLNSRIEDIEKELNMIEGGGNNNPFGAMGNLGEMFSKITSGNFSMEGFAEMANKALKDPQMKELTKGFLPEEVDFSKPENLMSTVLDTLSKSEEGKGIVNTVTPLIAQFKASQTNSNTVIDEPEDEDDD